MIVVLDTNILIRAAFRRNVDSDNLLARASRLEFELATSAALLEELRRMLTTSRLERRFQWRPGEPDSFLDEVRRVAFRVEPEFELRVVRDSADNRVLEAAVEAEADLVVSVDNDLLDLAGYEGIRIVTEAEFVAILRSQRL